MAGLVIGWVGMGRMGYPMAERLLKAGHDVKIWNRLVMLRAISQMQHSITASASNCKSMQTIAKIGYSRIKAPNHSGDFRNDKWD